MKKMTALKTLLRSPVKTLLTFLLIAAASFALFSRMTDYAVTTKETKNAESLYHAVASLNNKVPDIPITTAAVDSPDGSESTGYCTIYKTEDKPWLTEEQRKEFSSLPGVTLADTRYVTAGRVEDYKRLLGDGDYGGFVLFEGTYTGYDDGESVLEDHVRLKFDDVKVVACEEGAAIETASVTTESAPLGEMYYARSPYTRAFYDSLEKGSRCLVLASKEGTGGAKSGIWFRPQDIGEGALCVIDGQPDNYLETEAFALQKGWVDAINHNLSVYDIVYTSDMRAIPVFNEQSMVIARGRILTAEDTDACVVSEDFLKEHGLSIGDTINVQLGDKLGSTIAETTTEDWKQLPDAGKIPQFVKSAELAIVGSYSGAKGDRSYSPSTIYVPAGLLPVEVPEDYKGSSGFSVFVENAHDIEAFHEAAEQFSEELDLTLEFSDRGWLDVKDSLGMGALASLLTTVLYMAGAALALFLAVYLYIGRNKKSYAIMRTLGVPARAAGNSMALPFVAVSALAMPIGGIAGLYYARRTAEKALLRMADSAPAGYVPDAEMPISVGVLCLLSELLFVSLTAYLFLRKMKKTPPLELLQEGVARVRTDMKTKAEDASVLARIDMAKLSAAREWMPQGNYGPLRHVAAYIWRHMRRAVGKTAVSLILAAMLAGGIGTLVLAGFTYRNAFYELGVKGKALDFTFMSVKELSNSPLVKDFYCRGTFGVRVKGADFDIPMTITSDLARNLGKDCVVNYAEGYDPSAFEGTAQVCLVGKELAEKLGISPGDELGVLSDLLYSTLKAGEAGEDAASEGYKAYKVIGVAEAGDTSVTGGIFTGIRSDLERLFSMDFPVGHCEFTLADNEKFDELDSLLAENKDKSWMLSPNASYHLDAGGLADIKRVRGLLEALFPIAVAAAVFIGLSGAFLNILQSAQEAAFLRILGVTKKRARCMLVFEQIVLCLAGTILVAGGIALSNPGLFAESARTLAPCYGLYFMGCVCGASVAAVQVTKHRILELLQVKE